MHLQSLKFSDGWSRSLNFQKLNCYFGGNKNGQNVVCRTSSEAVLLYLWVHFKACRQLCIRGNWDHLKVCRCSIECRCSRIKQSYPVGSKLSCAWAEVTRVDG